MAMRVPNSYWRGLEDPEFLKLKGYAKIKHFRFRIWELHGGICGICGEPVDFARMDVDHIQPTDLGGKDHYTNMQPSHVRCNRSKADFGLTRTKSNTRKQPPPREETGP